MKEELKMKEDAWNNINRIVDHEFVVHCRVLSIGFDTRESFAGSNDCCK
jgi:hypothetical protein